jgi:hypothetical protein
MIFPVNLCTIKRNLVFMNIFYRKVAVTSACTVLSFVLGASPEAKAASFTFTSVPSFVVDIGFGGNYRIFPGGGSALKGTIGEVAMTMEFNIGSLFMDTNTVITSAVLGFKLGDPYHGLGVSFPDKPSNLGIFGYVANGLLEGFGGGKISEAEFTAGVFLSSVDISSLSTGDTFNFNVTEFINQRVSNGDAFPGLTIRALDFGGVSMRSSNEASPLKWSLIVQTADVAEPVPEPTTIFGSAIALGIGGWLKRKKSSQRNKTMS